MIGKRLALSVPPIRRLYDSRNDLQAELALERRRAQRRRRAARRQAVRGSFVYSGSTPKLRSTTDRGGSTVSTYDWEGRKLRLVTRTADVDAYTEYVRSDLRIEPHVQFILEWLAGFGRLVDIGANVGVVSIPVAVSGTAVLAVEPLPANYELLNQAARINGDVTITTVHGAAGRQRGSITMAGEGPYAHANDDGGVVVPMYGMDDLLQLTNFGAPDVIKIDVEGFEREVLAGLADTIEDGRPVILIESNPWALRGKAHFRDILKDLEGFGYFLYLINEGTLTPRTSSDPQESTVADYVATPHPFQDSVGSFEVRPLTDDERIELLELELGRPFTHQWHLASTLVADAALLPNDPRLDAMREALESTNNSFVRAALTDPWS